MRNIIRVALGVAASASVAVAQGGGSGSEPPPATDPPAELAEEAGETAEAERIPERDFAQEWWELLREAQGIREEADDGAAVLGRVLEAASAVLHPRGGDGEEPGDDDDGPFDFGRVLDVRPSDEAKAAAKRVLDRLEERGVFTGLKELSAYRGVSRPKPEGPLLSVGLPELGAVRGLARAQRYRLRLAAEEGRWGDAAEVVEEMVPLAAVYLRRPMMIEQLAGIAIAQGIFEEIGRSVTGRIRDERACGAMRRAVERLPRAGIATAVAGDRLVALEAVARSAPEQGNEAVAGREEESAKVEEFAARATAVAELEPGRWTEGAIALDEWSSRLPERFVITRLLTPTIVRVLFSRDRTEAHRRGVVILLAVEAHRVQRGRYPETLEQLVPEFLAQLPADPYSRNGETFRYRRVDPAVDSGGRAFVLYSVGWDRVDNAGRQHPGSNAMATSEGVEGYDFVINPTPDEDGAGWSEPMLDAG